MGELLCVALGGDAVDYDGIVAGGDVQSCHVYIYNMSRDKSYVYVCTIYIYIICMYMYHIYTPMTHILMCLPGNIVFIRYVCKWYT